MAALPRHAPGRPATGLGHYLRDLVYGATDGAITTLVVVAGATAAGFAPIVAIVLGLANVVADGLSMAAGNYLGIVSELRQQGISPAEERPVRHALATFAAFALAGSVPLLAYALPPLLGSPFPLAALLALAVLGAVGAARAPFTAARPLGSGLEMLLVGGAAALAAWVVGAAVAPLVR